MDEETVIEEATASALAESRNGSGSGPGFILGLLVGGLAGAAVAVLLSPSAGEETGQHEAVSPFESAGPQTPVDRARGVLAGVRARVREAAEEGRIAAREAEERSRTRYAELTHQERPSE